MSALLDWIKLNVKEGANLAEVEELISGDSLSGIPSKEKALELLYTNKALKAAFDSEISRKVDDHDKRFRETKLPELLERERTELRAKLNSEMNPEETPEQKRIRERMESLEERVRKADARDLLIERQRVLREKAKELDYDPERAARFAILGDDAEKFLADEASFYKKALDAQREQIINGTLGGNPPPGGERLSSEMSLEKIDSMSIAEIEAAYK